MLKEHWAYIRHIEEARVNHLNVYVALSGGITGAFVLSRAQGSLLESLTRDPVLAGAAFLFLFVYGLLIAMYTTEQKKAYTAYRNANAAITAWFKRGADAPAIPDLVTTQSKVSAFIFWRLSIGLISAAMLCLAGLAVAPALQAEPLCLAFLGFITGVVIHVIAHVLSGLGGAD